MDQKSSDQRALKLEKTPEFFTFREKDRGRSIFEVQMLKSKAKDLSLEEYYAQKYKEQLEQFIDEVELKLPVTKR